MVGYTLFQKEKKPEWLAKLLKSKFYRSCFEHRDLRKNEMNVFCTDCNRCICSHCIGSASHWRHKLLQIRRYVYHDVIRLHDMQKLLDCSKVQSYTINGAKVLFLNARPQAKPSKSNSGSFCEICERNLTDPFRYCSIACKVSDSAVTEKGIDRPHSFMLCGDSFPIPVLRDFSSSREDESPDPITKEDESPSSSSADSNGNNRRLDSVLKPKRQLHKRKGIPRRSPVY